MRLQVKGKNVEVTPSIREYAERKLAKLGKQLAEQTQVEVELSEQRNPSIAESHVAEGTIFTKGPTLRAREATSDMKASIDQLVEKLERQVTRYREMRRLEPRRHGEHHGDTVHFVALEDGSLVVDEDEPDDSLAPLADAIEATLRPPYRAEAVRRTAESWGVGASRIAIISAPALRGDEAELVATRDGQTLRVDGRPVFGSAPDLERLGEAEGPEYVVRATRLEGHVWEVEANPL